MNGKAKSFPLSLAQVVAPAAQRNDRRANRGAPPATPQTATRNALDHKKPSAGSSPVSAAPLVSDAVRRAMVQRLEKQGIRDPQVLAAMQAVPRHAFIDSALAAQAYIDASLPIGHHQTISQPYIVARMLEILCHGKTLQNVLEIGTGCGYQAAVLSQLARQVVSIERIKHLHELAKNNLRPLKLGNIRLHYGDGMVGLAQAAPFDGIILAAAGIDVPPALLQQMQIGARLIAPVGVRQQTLQLIERLSESEWSSVSLESCHFVPLRAGIV